MHQVTSITRILMWLHLLTANNIFAMEEPIIDVKCGSDGYTANFDLVPDTKTKKWDKITWRAVVGDGGPGCETAELTAKTWMKEWTETAKITAADITGVDGATSVPFGSTGAPLCGVVITSDEKKVVYSNIKVELHITEALGGRTNVPHHYSRALTCTFNKDQPAPTSGSRRVTIPAVSNQFYVAKTVIICEGQKEEISCSEGLIIRIKEAFYGRQTEDVCPTGGFGDLETCNIEMGANVITNKCDMKQKCTVSSSGVELGKGDEAVCESTHNYVRIRYYCRKLVEAQQLSSGSCEKGLTKDQCRHYAEQQATSLSIGLAVDTRAPGCSTKCQGDVCEGYGWNPSTTSQAECNPEYQCICAKVEPKPTEPPTLPTTKPPPTTTVKPTVAAVEAVNLKCAELDMTATFDPDILPGDILNITVSGCDNDNFKVTGDSVNVAFKDCANNITQSKDLITQENIVAVVNGVREKTNVVQRIVVYYYKLQCYFDRKINIHYGKTIYIKDREESFEQASKTNFAATMEMFQSANYQHLATSPYQVVAFSPIYMQIRGIHNNELFKFITTSCYATPTPDANDRKKYLFFESKCKMDNTFRELHHGSVNKFMFKIDAFTFIKLKKVVYFHCDLLVCKEDDESEDCTQKCTSLERRRRRRRRSADAEPEGRIEEITVRSGKMTWEDESVLDKPLYDQKMNQKLEDVQNELSAIIEKIKTKDN